MRNLLALLLFVPSLCLAQSVTLPYNPDANADSAIGAPDLLEMLPLFGGYFTPDPILIDGMEINEYLNMLEENGSSTLIEGSEHGQMLYWNGEEWTLVPAGAHGEVLTIQGTTPTWQVPSEDDTPEVGCADQTACNYDAGASVNWAPLCVYEDECGVCDGPGAIYECGCADLPEGDCDCDGNQLDALNVCGGTCAADVDGDGICDDGDDCIGEADECGVCNGPGAIYECGCTGIAPEECDCDGTPDVDQDGICDTEDPCIGVADSDGDGICDDVDDCDGLYDLCGICNGPGPIYDCGCTDIPEGDCDCAGNQADSDGNCQDYALDTDGDGILDSLVDPCLGQSAIYYFGQTYDLIEMEEHCWFQQNLASVQYSNGDSLSSIINEAEWNATSDGAYCSYDNNPIGDDVFGLLYNFQAINDSRNVCPTAWRVASESEWSTLISNLGGPDSAGGAMKSAGTVHWANPNAGATNSSGFSALPSGERGYGTTGFRARNLEALFWTSTIAGSNGAYSVRLVHDAPTAEVYVVGATRGRSIRCLRIDPVFGCTDINFVEYNPVANVNDGSCSTPGIPGCTDPDFEEYSTQANIDSGSCENLINCSDTNVIQYHGYDYQVVALGNQCWFQENLRSTQYRNEDIILNYQDPTEWASLNSDSIGSYASWNNNASHSETFGFLYNWFAVNDERKLCPVGWHVPSEDEWLELESTLGVPVTELELTGPRGLALNVGGIMRQPDNFYGIEGSKRHPSGSFAMNAGNYGGYWWSSTPSGTYAWGRRLFHANPGIYRHAFDRRTGHSIRCLRD